MTAVSVKRSKILHLKVAPYLSWLPEGIFPLWGQRNGAEWSFELAIIISCLTSGNGIIVFLKTPTKYREFLPTSFVETTDFQLVFNFEQRRTLYLESMAHIP